MKKTLTNTNGTIANTIFKHMDEIQALGIDHQAVKEKVIELINSPECTVSAGEKNLQISRIQNMKGHQIDGMVSTLLLGQKTI